MILLAVFSMVLSPRVSWAQNSSGPAPVALFVGETLYYTIDFWLFHGSATGELCFKKTPSGYAALFEAETRGMLGLIGGHRKEIMESIMEYDELRQRLRPVFFTETFIKNKIEYKLKLAFDYKKGTFTCTRTYPQSKPRVTQGLLPNSDFEDLLTFFYNSRLGCYGPRRDGVMFKAPVIMKEQPSFIALDFPPQGTKDRERGFNAAITMDRNLTHARSRRVLVCLSDDAVAESALVIDAYFFGDLVVRLIGRTYH